MRLATGLSLGVVVFLSARSPAPAQSFKWWQDEQFKKDLSLTPDQSARIEEIFQATFPKLRASREELERLETELSGLMSESDVTEAEILQQVEVVEAARSEMSKTRTLMLFRIRQVLSPEQRQRLKVLHERGQRDRRKQQHP